MLFCADSRRVRRCKIPLYICSSPSLAQSGHFASTLHKEAAELNRISWNWDLGIDVILTTHQRCDSGLFPKSKQAISKKGNWVRQLSQGLSLALRLFTGRVEKSHGNGKWLAWLDVEKRPYPIQTHDSSGDIFSYCRPLWQGTGVSQMGKFRICTISDSHNPAQHFGINNVQTRLHGRPPTTVAGREAVWHPRRRTRVRREAA